MKNACLIKSFANGICLHLDAEIPFEELLHDVAEKFAESRAFFKNAKMALSLKGRVLSDEEEKRIIRTITENSDIQILCIVSEDEDENRKYLRAISQIEALDDGSGNGNGQFYKGTLKNGQVLETESSIVIIGDVYPGSSIISAKDIIILGGLYGEAYAGADGRATHFVAALEMAPQRLRIGHLHFGEKEKPRWTIKPKIMPKMAYIKNERILMEPITKELLSCIPG